ncbi:hypothetical protein [Frondihabitans australicus]|uniref:hypothetical protein n=1 Tax=Frondihabitans australicus TaxID=386892 RepID=UPI0011C43710|nr:hypothetical protein [Frondihabitans australicus]
MTYTTDSDLALDPDLLTDVPNIGALLLAAGYQRHSSPGRFFSPDGIPIDLMVPDGALPRSSRRTAVLAGQSPSTARRTAGLEAALFDNSLMMIRSFESDERQEEIRVAGPASLVVAKIVKIRERLGSARVDRVISKDAGDVLRLLRLCDATTIGTRMAELVRLPTLTDIVTATVAAIHDDLSDPRSRLVALATEEFEGFEPPSQVETAFRVLGGRLHDAYTDKAQMN